MFFSQSKKKSATEHAHVLFDCIHLKERMNLNSDYIMDLPEEERLEILRLMIKDVDVDDRSMMVENLLEGLSGNERKEMIVEELDTFKFIHS